MARILVAEDDVILGESLVEILEMQGHTLQVAQDGKDAWSMLRNGQFDILIADYILPSMDGLAIINRIEADAGLDDLRILVISGYEVRQFELHPRVEAVFHKPFDLKAVFEAIHKNS